ncbi:MAG TPA: exodeoxyribonuclease VII large subunit [Candidatus Margulisiibacteriota bacterium]|nr:exodeoxyribonuclease VII large subunit [Candidatus Margulisiibacteriota bacterium]
MQLPLDLAALTTVLTVSQLNQRVRETLDAELGEFWVVGEISNFRVPPSGHFYFSLKDDRSQIAAVMFRSANQLLAYRPDDGMEVIVRGRIGLYEVRGALQLYVEAMEPRGLGSLQLALEQLKKRLAAEGLFAEARKRPLPFLPRAVGIVTALGGAAIHDLLVVLRTRLPGVRIVVRPVRVQGKEAPADIVRAIAEISRVAAVDVLIVGRGGGSLEDLWAFNDEGVARAIAAARMPVVSAVGHEIDVTIADLVADRRAPTPTAAAAMVVPDHHDLHIWFERMGAGLLTGVQRQIARQRERLTAQARHLRDPRQVLRALQLRVDELSERALRGVTTRLRLARQQLRGGAERLQALSPLAVLARGYSITRRADTGAVVRDASSLQAGDCLHLTLARGSARVRVDDPDRG